MYVCNDYQSKLSSILNKPEKGVTINKNDVVRLIVVTRTKECSVFCTVGRCALIGTISLLHCKIEQCHES